MESRRNFFSHTISVRIQANRLSLQSLIAMRMRYLLILGLLIALPLQSFSQSSVIFGRHDHGYSATCLAPDADGGFWVGGNGHDSATPFRYWVAKFDAHGAMTRDSIYTLRDIGNCINEGWLYSIQPTTFGGVLISGRDKEQCYDRAWCLWLDSNLSVIAPYFHDSPTSEAEAVYIGQRAPYTEFGRRYDTAFWFYGQDYEWSRNESAIAGEVVVYSSKDSRLHPVSFGSFRSAAKPPVYAGCATQTSDGGLIVSGTIDTFQNRHTWITRLGFGDTPDSLSNSNSRTLWTHLYVYTKGVQDAPNKIVQTQNGFAVFGFLYRAGMRLLLLDSLGNTISDTSYGTDTTACYSGTVTSDGGYVFVGQSAQGWSSFGSSRAFAMKTDRDGHVQWSKAFEAGKGTICHDVFERNGVMVLAGETEFNDTSKLWMIYLDLDGNQVSYEGKPLASAENATASNGVRIFPNPIPSGAAQLSVSGDITEVLLLNSLGEPVWRHQTDATTTAPIDVSALAPGMYIVRIRTAKGVVLHKVIRE
jgi:hypothetical protein